MKHTNATKNKDETIINIIKKYHYRTKAYRNKNKTLHIQTNDEMFDNNLISILQ